MHFEDHGITGGIWTARLTGAPAPGPVHVMHYAERVAQAQVTSDGPGAWLLRAEVPGRVISHGVHTLVLVMGGADDATGAQVLGRTSLMAGSALDHDLLAEVAQLRAELDLLKREFRRAQTQR